MVEEQKKKSSVLRDLSRTLGSNDPRITHLRHVSTRGRSTRLKHMHIACSDLSTPHDNDTHTHNHTHTLLMDSSFDVPDSTDWLNTPLAALADLESALHCQICKEFFDTPMITSCSHTFCSRCIRTSLSADGRCPACRASDQASKLRNNWQLQEVVSTFLVARPQAIKIAREERDKADDTKKSTKRKRAILESDEATAVEKEGRTTRSKSRRTVESQGSQADAIQVDDSDEDASFEPDEPKDDGLVECPLGCGKRMKIESVEPHLDRCEDEKAAAKRAKSRTPVAGLSSSRTSTRNTPRVAPRPQDRISELNYSLLKEGPMRKKMDELGLPGFGSKQLMVRRHTEWVNLWNANCDSSNPRSKRELLQDLDTWERTQGGERRLRIKDTGSCARILMVTAGRTRTRSISLVSLPMQSERKQRQLLNLTRRREMMDHVLQKASKTVSLMQSHPRNLPVTQSIMARLLLHPSYLFTQTGSNHIRQRRRTPRLASTFC
jgi:E3 ubiquitin-protein ligase RAD18